MKLSKRKVKKDTNKKSLWGTIGIGTVLVLSKLKWVAILLKVLKLKTLISMAIYLAVYGFMFGWKFAVALVYLLFIHEMGHLYAAKKLKMPTTPAIFIPFMGAVIGMKEKPKSAKDEAYLAYMGPMFGLLSFLPAIPIYLFTENPFWALIIVFGAMLNLFNLIPFTPLDGGRIVAGISTKLWGLGLVLLLAYAVWSMSIIAFLVLIVGSMSLYGIYKEQKNVKEREEAVVSYEVSIPRLKEFHLEAKEESVLHIAFINVAKSVEDALVSETLETMIADLEVAETDEEKERNRELFIEQYEKEVNELRTELTRVKEYYKTDKKTKWKIFGIYMFLIIVLGLSFYLSIKLLPDIDMHM